MPKELRRAVELEGSNGRILGTEDYISAVNNYNLYRRCVLRHER